MDTMGTAVEATVTDLLAKNADAEAELAALRADNERLRELLLALQAPTPAALVAEFHRAFGLPIRSRPEIGSTDEVVLRDDLIEEETQEVIAALWAGDLPALAQELADLIYVTYGTAIQFGIDLDAVVAEVHRANMTKLGFDGKPVRRADGKVMKGDYTPPDVAAVLGLT